MDEMPLHIAGHRNRAESERSEPFRCSLTELGQSKKQCESREACESVQVPAMEHEEHGRGRGGPGHVPMWLFTPQTDTRNGIFESTDTSCITECSSMQAIFLGSLPRACMLSPALCGSAKFASADHRS